MTDDLVRWLGEQLDEDETEARRGYLKAEPLPDYDGWDKSTTASLPPAVAARVLREIDAKRRIIEQHERYAAERRRMMGGWDPQSDDSPILAALALVYADRPGYRDEWKP